MYTRNLTINRFGYIILSMNSKNVRKRRSDRNQVIYFIQDKVTLEYYIGLTAMEFKGNIRKTLNRRMQKHMQRAMTEIGDSPVREYGTVLDAHLTYANSPTRSERPAQS